MTRLIASRLGILTAAAGATIALALAGGLARPDHQPAPGTVPDGKADPRTIAPAPKGTEWTIDPVHSSNSFRVKHFNTAYFYGRFDEMTGTVTTGDTGLAAMDVTIKVGSVSTRNARRDGHLKSPDFFNAEKFPTATFRSTKVAKAADDEFEVSGDLTIHGVTRAVTVRVRKTGEGKGQGGPIIGFETRFDLKRSDFGMTYMPDGIGDDVNVAVSIEAGKV